MPFLETNDSVAIHYETVGSGPPLIFIHGWSLAEPVWRFQTECFRDRYRCICMDLRGHGKSSAPDAGYGIEEFASDLSYLCEQLDLTEATLAGWSLGAIISLAAYPRLRDRLRSLILVSGTPKFTSTEEYRHGLPAKESRGLSLRLKRNPEQTLDAFFRLMFTPEEMCDKVFEPIGREIVPLLGRPSPPAALHSLDSLASADVRVVLSDIRIPVLLIHGDRDAICLPDASRYMAERIPCAHPVVMPGAGHAPMMTRPREFNSIVDDFLGRIYGID